MSIHEHGLRHDLIILHGVNNNGLISNEKEPIEDNQA
jgi:hypothetical protein